MSDLHTPLFQYTDLITLYFLITVLALRVAHSLALSSRWALHQQETIVTASALSGDTLSKYDLQIRQSVSNAQKHTFILNFNPVQVLEKSKLLSLIHFSKTLNSNTVIAHSLTNDSAPSIHYNHDCSGENMHTQSDAKHIALTFPVTYQIVSRVNINIHSRLKQSIAPIACPFLK
jgi:hypothetical protein